jgi:very-short-patch-repair endonuclease
VEDFPLTRCVLHHVVGEVDRAFFTRETEGEPPVSRMDRESLDRARRMRSEMTRAEVILWTRLQRRQLLGFQFKRQKKIGPYYADFACSAAMLVVEVDGATHSSAEERAYDAARTAFLESQGWTVVRVWNDDVYRNEVGVVETILRYLEARG